MKNFKILLIQELRSQMRTFTFMVMIPVALVVSLLVTNLQLSSYKDRRDVFEEQQRQSQEQLDNVYFYSRLKVDVYMPPALLSVFAKGLDESIGNKITVSALDLPELTTTSQRGNAFIRLFNSIDITGIVRIMSIFIVLLAACPIAQEREQQTGKLIFANSAGRLEYYFSKYTALMAIAGIMVLVTFLVPIVWMWFDPKVGLSLVDIGSIILMMVSSILYLSVFVLISLAISAASPKISIATLASLMVWVTLAYIYPFTANSMIDRLVKVPSDNSVTEQIEKIDTDIMLEGQLFVYEHNLVGGYSCRMSSDMHGIIVENRLSDKTTLEGNMALLNYVLPKWLNRVNLVSAIKEDQKKHLLRKKTLYDHLTFFIPDRIYQNLCEQVSGTDYGFREKNFTDAAKNYRSVLIGYMQSKNGFGYPFFTQMPESEMRERGDKYPPPVEDRYCKDENLDKINAVELPKYSMSNRSKNTMAWTGLLLMNLVFGSLSLWIYNKYLSFK